MPKVFATILICLIFLSVFRVKSVYALDCTANISPTSVNLGSSSLNFSTTNEGSETVILARITITDSSVFEITEGNMSGWNASVNGAELIFSGGSLGSGQTTTLTFTVDGLSEGIAY